LSPSSTEPACHAASRRGSLRPAAAGFAGGLRRARLGSSAPAHAGARPRSRDDTRYGAALCCCRCRPKAAARCRRGAAPCGGRLQATTKVRPLSGSRTAARTALRLAPVSQKNPPTRTPAREQRRSPVKSAHAAVARGVWPQMLAMAFALTECMIGDRSNRFLSTRR
jgi:hypothetical protein